MMRVSVGIMAYNEEKNIGMLLHSLINQKAKKTCIREIIVVSSGSTDRTEEIVNDFTTRDYRIALITQKNREGKASAINLFLSHARSRIIVLISADTIPEKTAIETLCRQLQDVEVGIVCARVISASRKGMMCKISELQWEIHHNLSMISPKFGEMIAFQNCLCSIESTAADEEYIAMRIKEAKLQARYEPKSLVYNSGPHNLADFILQRRRIHAGHRMLKKKHGYVAVSLKPAALFKATIRTAHLKNAVYLCIFMLMEGIARTMGLFDYLSGKDHSIWEVAQTTKKVWIRQPSLEHEVQPNNDQIQCNSPNA